MRKRYYLLFVARDSEGQLLKIPIPLHYMYVFLAGALLGMFTITGMAGSYTRMLLKVASFNQLRSEKQALASNYTKLEQVAQEKEIQAASLGSLASEISALYGLRSASPLTEGDADEFTEEKFTSSLQQFNVLRTSAMNGAATVALSFGTRNSTPAEWMRLAAAPNLWPVEGVVTSSFGQRSDPFSGEGAFHRGVDISTAYGSRVIAPADGVVRASEFMSGYGRAVVIDHGNGVSTLYGHLSGFAVTEGQQIRRGETVGYVGSSGRSNGAHLHYEVRIQNTPVNPHKYLRTTIRSFAAAGV